MDSLVGGEEPRCGFISLGLQHMSGPVSVLEPLLLQQDSAQACRCLRLHVHVHVRV